MAKKILRLFAFVSLILLLGQIPVGQKTVGHHYQTFVFSSVRSAGEWIASSDWYQKVQEWPIFSAILPKPARKQQASHKPIEDDRAKLVSRRIPGPEPVEEMSETDKESLLKLLP